MKCVPWWSFQLFFVQEGESDSQIQAEVGRNRVQEWETDMIKTEEEKKVIFRFIQCFVHINYKGKRREARKIFLHNSHILHILLSISLLWLLCMFFGKIPLTPASPNEQNDRPWF